MQLYIEFETDGLRLPMAYRHRVQSMIYRALERSGGRFRSLHDGGAEAQGRRFKLFTFGQLEGRYTAGGGFICFNDRVSLEIRGVDDEMLFCLFRYFSGCGGVELGENRLTVAECRLSDRHISGECITAETRSPIVAFVTEDDGSTRFFSPDEARFCEIVMNNARRKWLSFCGDADGFELSVSPAEGARFKKQVTLFKRTRITAWDGRFVLRGRASVLDMLYNTGLGAKSSQGFGMFDVV